MSMWQITVLFNGKRQAAYLLDESHVVIGRGRSAHIPLDNNPIVSRQHATITADPSGKYIVEDLGGANGTFINDRRLASEHRLMPGDTIVLGKHALRFEEATRNATSLRSDRRPRGGHDPVITQAIPAIGGLVSGSTLGLPSQLGSAQENASAPWDSRGASVSNAGGMAGQERTMAASKEELEHLLEQMKIKAQPHLSFQRKRGGVAYLPLPEGGFSIGHADHCDLTLRGSHWWPMGKVAGVITARRTHNGRRWWLVAKAPWLNPVSVNGKKVKQKRELRRGSVIAVGLRKLRFSPGETE
jgi:pSer/pThr/pTyr-binding forkhead associated (FHA) protein